MSETVEQRLKPTLIRRRAKVEEPSPPKEEATKPVDETAPSAKVAEPPIAKQTIPATSVATKLSVAAKPSAPQTPPPVGAKPAQLAELEDKFKKAPRKKLSKAEMELEDIKRAGGLMHFVQEEIREEPQAAVIKKERVFEPGPRRKKQVRREFKKTKVTETKAEKKVIRIADSTTVSALSQEMGVKSSELIKKLMDLGTMVTANQPIDVDTATLLASEHGFEVENVKFKEEKVFDEVKKERESLLLSRPPVVTVMGHVDHGKTSILDKIRKADVAAGEAGGITQHIGAYIVETQKGKITFIDTPGHAAFTAMRARGAKVTDLVILVVAADDGVMPQTKEAIAHAKAANVPIIVAINKIDKPEANLERTKRSLSENNIIPEEWGGDAICVATSARNGQGIDQLLEMVLLQAEMMELKADVKAPVKGTIIEAKLSRGKGPVATVLIQQGTLKLGTSLVCGLHFGKVRAIVNHQGISVESAGPSEPVEVLGLSGVPQAGDEVIEVSDEKLAKIVSDKRQEQLRLSTLSKLSKVTLEDLHKQVTEGKAKELNVVLKTDVHGSVEAIKGALEQIPAEQVKVKVVHAGVGGVTESDVMLAAASKAIIVGFNVVPEFGVAGIAEREGVEIRRYSIIYELIDDVKKAMEGILAPLAVEKITGHAEVRQVFSISKVGTIAGSFVIDGKVPRTARVRLTRDHVIIFDGKLSSLKRFKDDVKEVAEGYECGIGIENYNDIKVGDIVEAYIVEQVAQKLA